MLTYLMDGVFQDGMQKDQRRKLALRSRPYLVISCYLYKRGINDVVKRCVLDHEQKYILIEAHSEDAGGHFSGQITSRKYIPIRIMVANSGQRYISNCENL